MSANLAVGIDLGTTYSCIACLNEQGEPVSIPNQEGEISTPSVVMFDRDEVIVGTEALRNAIMAPGQVVQNAKRYMGDPDKRWTIGERTVTPVDVSAAILGKLLRDAGQQLGPVSRAVITVPAQFSDAQRRATVEAGLRAGLLQVDLINEPVAAALCYVLGTEGLWFTELASEQRILVYDLGGGTFDLSLVSYSKDQVRVIASTGDLHLGGIDWNERLLHAAADQFTREFDDDPRRDPESLQHLALEVEQCKRSLTVRPRAALIVQHGGRRKTYQIERSQFQQVTQELVDRTETITRKLIDAHRRGASRLDLTVLSTGGSSRMPMIETMLAGLKGTTVSKALSPDQSIAHGATYYAGMLLANSEMSHAIIDPQAAARLSRMRQQSVNARALGILVRDMDKNQRVPYYLIPPDTPLPAAATETFGTVIPNQKRVTLFIVESGAGTDKPYVELGTCTVDGLPPDLPVESRVAVTIRYDESARVQVSALDKTSGRAARVEIHRGENLRARDVPDDDVVAIEPRSDEPGAFPVPARGGTTPSAAPRPVDSPQPVAPQPLASKAVAVRPVPAHSPAPQPVLKPVAAKPSAPPPSARPVATQPTPARPAAAAPAAKPGTPQSTNPPPVAKPATPAAARPAKPTIKPVPGAGTAPRERVPSAAEIMELPRPKPASPPAKKKRPPPPPGEGDHDAGAEEFWKLAGE